MASTLVTRSASQLQAAKASFAGKAPRAKSVAKSANTRRFVVRAEVPAKSERNTSTNGLFLAGVSDQSLSYLDGSLPADFGFDPLGLSDPEGAGGFIDPSWLAYSEVIHGRWAMLGAAGCIGPEILASAGAIPQSPADVIWFKTGVIPPAGEYTYWTNPYALFFVEVIAMQFAELKRLQDYRYPGSQGKQYFLGLEAFFNGSGNPAYPGGGFFNFAGFGNNSESAMKELKTKELRNGRLAMLAMFGYGAQAVMTGKGPFQNLADHLSDPTGKNILTNFATAFTN